MLNLQSSTMDNSYSVSKKKGKLFQDHYLIYNDFIDLKIMSSSIRNKFNKNTNEQEILWNDIKL